jgi:hypothetical protein
MATTETGHAKNVANFEQLISYCTAYGTTYNPTKAAIKLTAMNTLLTNAQAALATVKEKQNAYTVAVDAREILFDPLSKLVTRIIFALESSEVTKQKITDAKSIARKIKGTRATPKKVKESFEPSTDEAQPTEKKQSDEPKQISASQLSFDNRLENFAKLINLLSSETGYAPNETELKIATLNTMLASMKTKNTAVINAITALSNARIERNKILYKENTGLYAVTLAVKAYIKSVFGQASPEYKQINSVKFTSNY